MPRLTQPPIKPGETFTYEFTPPDAGSFWYHPHANSLVQLGRGLAGVLIIEERVPIAVDREPRARRCRSPGRCTSVPVLVRSDRVRRLAPCNDDAPEAFCDRLHCHRGQELLEAAGKLGIAVGRA